MKIFLFIIGLAVGAGAFYGAVDMQLVPGISKSTGDETAKTADDILAKIKEAGVLKVGVKTDSPPFGVKEMVAGKPDWFGFDIDIARAIAKEMGIKKIQFSPVTSKNRLDLVKSGDIDMAIASMTITRSRDEGVDFSMPYFQDGQALMVKSDSEIDGYSALAGKTVGGAEGSTSLKTIKEVQPDCKVKAFTGGYKEAFDALRKGEIDALTTDYLILKGLLLNADDADNFALLEDKFSTEPYGIAIAENQSNMRDAVNEAIQRLWETGKWQRIYEEWFGENARYRSDNNFSVSVFPK